MTQQRPAYGVVPGPPIGEISRRRFLRRVLGAGVGILSLEFLGGTLAFLWPNLTEGLGAEITIGDAATINTAAPDWQNGLPYIYGPANLFIVNVPAAKERVEGNGTVASPVPDPGANVAEDLAFADRSVMALWRKCPHLGCQIPQLCNSSQWFECLCHGSKYTVLSEKRDGPAPRGMDHFPVSVSDGVYVVNTAEVVSGPPPGTVTFDERAPTDMSHCTG